ncbi:leucine-rich repeat serine/threonine-protein kinase 2 isoform X3 [Hemibagrus wyckioides]|uniref:leucine-rich repeat serine/threonine-protein kinase 2 isoform X3 n=1 Tax=Hemibagrus wyckioides TaxID=337641 RepID=UPI00266B90E0|nr:leucine-rich repeat serine/threonine-protein kinase 2 isoform X3 [Hemibagrus wyckioides]
MVNKEDLEKNLKKLLVRLKNNLEEGQQLGSMLQIIQDLLFLAHADECEELFKDKDVHKPLVLLLSSCCNSKLQQVGWSLLCRLMEICPDTLDKLVPPGQAGKDWEVLGVHQQILNMLTLHQKDLRVVMVGLRALALLLRSDELMLLVLEEDMDVFELVVEAMKAFPHSEELQFQGCSALSMLLQRVPEEHQVEFMEKKDHAVVLNVLQRFKDSENVVLSALQVLIPLAEPASNVEILMSKTERCYSVVCRAVEAFSESEAVQEAGCCLLRKFTSESYFNILVLNGVHRAALRACLSYPDNGKIQAAALSCLAALTKTILENEDLKQTCSEEEDEGGKEDATDSNDEESLVWRDACCTALERHSDDAEVQEAACWALNGLLLYGSARSIYEEPKERPPVYIQVMTVMLVHSSCYGVFRAAAATLGTLIRRHSKMRSRLLASGIHYNIVELMKRHASSSEVCESACRLLYTLFQGGRSVNLDEGTMALGQILIVMKDHNFQPEVQLEGLKASLVLLNPDLSLREHGVSIADPDMMDVSLRVLKNQCVVEEAHTVYLQALNRFISSEDIQEFGLAVLTTLADCSGAVDVMCQQGAIDTVLHTLQMFPQKSKIHYWGLSLLFHLISKKKLSHMMVPVLVSVLIASLRQHRGSAEMRLKAFQVIWKLLDTCSGTAAELEKEGFEKDIFQQLRESSPDYRYDLKLSCLCLSRMVVDSEIHYRMLERACEEGDVVMAECLIQLGADVNKKTKTESLIYQVCERGGPLALVEVLLSSGVHEQQLRGALSVCVRRRDSPVVILLLARLGLDPTNSALCLGGFRLGHLEAVWLSALLSEHRDPPTAQKRNSKGQWLARQIQSLQKEHVGVNTSEYFSDDESDESFHTSLDGSVFFTLEDMESDGSDSPSSGRTYCDSPEDLRGRSNMRQQDRSRPDLSEGSNSDPNLSHSFKKRLESRKGKTQRALLFSESSSPGALLSNVDRDHIRLLDLSGNELDSLSCLMDEGSVQQQLEHLLRLDLSSNSLAEFPSALCQSLRSLTRLDLQGNQLQSLPAGLLSLPSLNTLNVSRNSVGPELCLDPHVCCPSLRQLNLSFNHITVFPYSLSQVMENLEELSLEGNQISELSLPLCLAEMKVFDISKNKLTVISDGLLSACTKLETFNASVNHLSCLLHLPSKITTLKLSQNNFESVPESITSLPNLRSVDMRNNSIKVLPGPASWASANLRELIFSENQISVLDLREPVYKWIRLEKLHLSDNRLTELPPQIGLLEELTSLDVSGNSGLRSFPDEMGKLVRLWDLPLDRLQLQLDLKHIGNKTKDIVRHFQHRLKKAVPYFRMKLIVVGNAGSGKTTLIQQLMKLKRSQFYFDLHSTSITVRDWTIRDRDRKNMLLNVWDFSGGEEYSGFHSQFMSSRALYLVLYDLSKGASELDTIRPWLFNIKALAPVAPVILVGTHLDVCDDDLVQECVFKIQEEVLSQPLFPTIRERHMLCACEESDSISRLRKAIAREAGSFKIQGQPVMGQLVPDCYVELERRLVQERSRVPVEFPVLRHQRLLQLIEESQLLLEEGELAHAVRFLSETGVLLHFDDPALQLRDLYFINPQWLCNTISQMLSQESLYERGVMQRSGVKKFLSESLCFPKGHLMHYFRLLEKFLIALPLGEEQLLVHCGLSDHKPLIEIPHCENSEIIVRVYEMPYYPMGFWSRLISQLLEVSTFMLQGREKALRPNRNYWRTGVYLNWSTEAYYLVEAFSVVNSPASFVRITVPCSRKGHVLLGQVVDHIDSVLEEWFPGLLNTDIQGDGETLLKKWAFYSFDDTQDWNKMLLQDLLKHSDKNGLLVNSEDPRFTIPTSQICPDLMLSDQPASIMLDPEELEMDLSNEYLLGNGGFGSVYRAIYKNEDVAMKIFNKHASELYVHRLVRQELAVLGRLHHPSLVDLLAVGSSPYVLVMEMAPCGSLDSLFEHENCSLNRKLQHRIALQVADGLRYLHSSMIIYRDLKPHNVLLFNLKTDSEMIAKLTDYGIAQYCCSMGLKSSEGTPGFRAPEVARGNVIYNVQADVYSFGLLLYDLLTCGERISDGLKFPSEFDEIAVQGKLLDPVKHYRCSPWPGFQNLMKECLRETPESRPTSAQVFDCLNSGKMLCLISELTLPGLSCECFTVSCPSGGLGGGVNGGAGAHVWTGGGSSSQKLGFVTCVNVETEKHSTQEIDQSPVLCLVTVKVPGEVHDWLVAGTQSGSLVVLDARNIKVLHCLQRAKDAVTSLFFHTPSQRSCLKNYLLVGTADGMLVIYEDSVIKCADGAPVKLVQVGNVNTPLMCLAPSGHYQDRTTLWAGCGTRVLSLTVDYDISKSIDTRSTFYHQQHLASSEACISRLVVEKFVYLSKNGGHSVEVWDKKTGKLIDFINCVQLLGKAKAVSLDSSKESLSARVKALLVQYNGTLWIGTASGHILLVDLSTHHLLQVINSGCHSVRTMASVLIETQGQKSVILMLGRRIHMSQEKIQSQSDKDAVLMMWSSSLSQEVKDLNRHCELREKITYKLQEQAYD